MPANTTLSAKQIAQVAATAGFNKSEDMLTKAVAVALAESGGETTAVSSTGCCHGLWQINVEVHPYTKTQMQDPAQNAAAAFSISKQGTNWNPWSAYTNASYLLHMPTAKDAVKGLTVTPGQGFFPENSPAGEVEDALSEGYDQFMEPINATREWISDRNNIFRILKVLAGVVMIAAGVVLVAKPLAESAVGGVAGSVVKGALKK